MMEKKGKYLAVWGRYYGLFREENLTYSEVGRLFCAMLDYQFCGQEPENLPPKLKGYWFFLKLDMENAQSSYEAKVESGRKGGRRSAQLRQEEQDCEASSEEKEAPKSNIQANASTMQANVSTPKQNQQITITESKSESITESISKKDSGSAPPSGEGGICRDKKSYGEYGWVKLTPAQYRRLEKLMGFATLQKCIDYVDRSAQTTNNKNRWSDWDVLLRRCYEGKWYECRSAFREPPTTGATGYLGKAELEAIQKLLQEDIPDVILPEEQRLCVSA